MTAFGYEVPGHTPRAGPAGYFPVAAFGDVEGRNLSFEFRYGDDAVARAPELATELIRLRARLSSIPDLPLGTASPRPRGRGAERDCRA
jgi:hypothetical protein